MTSGVPISKKLVFTNSASSVVARVINVALIVWLQSYLISRVPTDEYALYPVFMSGMMFLLLARTILSSGLVRYFSDAKALGDSQRIQRIASSMFAVALLVSAIALVAGTALALNIANILTVAPRYAVDAKIIGLILVASFSLQLLMAPFEVGLHVDQRFVLLNAIEIGTVVLRIALLLGLLLGVSTRVIWVVVANESAGVAALVARFAFSRRALPELKFDRRFIDTAVAKELLSFGSWSFVGQIGYRIRTYADPIVLNKLATSFDVTCFYLGNMVLRQTSALLTRITQTVLPGLTALNATGQHARLGRVFVRYNRLVIWAFMFFAVPLIVYRSELVVLYAGARFAPAATVMLLLMMSEGVGKSYSMLHKLAVARAKVRFLAVVGFALQVSNLSLTVVLVGAWQLGAVGAAVSTFVITVGLQSFLMVPYALRLADISFMYWFNNTVLPGFLPSVATGGFALLLKDLSAPIEGWGQMVAHGTIVIAVYIVTTYSVAFQPQDRRDLHAAALRFVSVFRSRRRV